MLPIHFRMIDKIKLEKYFLELPMFVANISDDCLLGIDFLSLIGIELNFRFALGISQEELICARLSRRNIYFQFS